MDLPFASAHSPNQRPCTTAATRNLAALSVSIMLSLPALAEGTVWLPTPESGNVTVSYVSQSADNMWVGKNGPNPIPFQGLDQKTLQFDATYGLADAWALNASVGTSEVSPKHGRPIPLSTDGRTDLEVGITWRFVDELISDAPSMAVRFGAILAGNYDAGGAGPAEVMGDVSRVGAGPTAIGDGSDGFELSGIVGKVFADRIAVSAELGTRNRGSDVPRETFMNLDGHLIAGQHLVLTARYYLQSSAGDLDIGPPPSPGKHGTYWRRFPHVAEDVARISLGGTLNFGDMSVGLHWFNVLDGRNTAEFEAVGGTFTYTFGR